MEGISDRIKYAKNDREYFYMFTDYRVFLFTNLMTILGQ